MVKPKSLQKSKVVKDINKISVNSYVWVYKWSDAYYDYWKPGKVIKITPKTVYVSLIRQTKQSKLKKTFPTKISFTNRIFRINTSLLKQGRLKLA